MTTLTIRKLEPTVKERLRLRAARQCHSMEEEARRILKEALATPDEHPKNAYEAICRRFASLGGIDLDLRERQPGRETPTFDLRSSSTPTSYRR